MARFSSIHALSVTVLGLLVGSACSSSSDGIANGNPTAIGGSATNGGSTPGGGSVAAPASGGSTSGNTLSSGGLPISGQGGSSGNVGSTGTGGRATNEGGTVSTGGSATGGRTANTGGSTSGGKSTSAGGASTGGKSTGTGATASGGVGTGGKASGGAGTGGKASGGTGTGGKASGGTGTGGKASGGTGTGGTSSSGSLSCSVTLPAATGTKNLSAPQPVSGSFDGGMVQYCGTGSLGSGGDAEGQDPLFNIANGGTLKNVIIGGPGCSAADGVHCAGSCTLENVWWGDVGEDAATFRGGGTKVVINGGGAFNASDKVFQDNTTGGDLVTINNFFVSTAGKLYRSCGTCANDDRHVVIQNVAYKSVSQLVGLNTNNGDTAKISGLIDCGGNGTICAAYTWVAEGTDPPRNGNCSY